VARSSVCIMNEIMYIYIYISDLKHSMNILYICMPVYIHVYSMSTHTIPTTDELLGCGI